jgi:hypothetical protein
LACRERFLFLAADPGNEEDGSNKTGKVVVSRRVTTIARMRGLTQSASSLSFLVAQLNKFEPLERFERLELFELSSDWFRTADCGSYFQS